MKLLITNTNIIFAFGIIFFSNFITTAKSFAKKNILILGGNGFIGGASTVALLDSGHNITLLSRGNAYYDSVTRIEPHVSKHILCDREKSLLLECKELVQDNTYYDVVIDFTAYFPKHVTHILETLTGRVGFYIFISSEAVYEVSAKNHTQPSKESEAIRPTSLKRREELHNKLPYGDEKLACEETLAKQEKEGIPYLILRLPVAIGPRDTTYR
jgi:nucleoside-diphosphate-sugar epimerase